MSDSYKPMDCSPPGSFVHGILQARIVEWVAMLSSNGSSQSRDQTYISYVSCISRWVLYHQCHQLLNGWNLCFKHCEFEFEVLYTEKFLSFLISLLFVDSFSGCVMIKLAPYNSLSVTYVPKFRIFQSILIHKTHTHTYTHVIFRIWRRMVLTL